MSAQRKNDHTTLGQLLAEYRAGKVTREAVKTAVESLTVIHDNALVQRPEMEQEERELEAG